MITHFAGDYRFLSNFWPAIVEFDGRRYPTVEHAYQAAKTLDIEERIRISQLPKAGDAKRAGRNIKMREDWEEVKLDIMEYLVRQKFQNTDLGLDLRLTWDHELIEGNNWHDRFWGCEKVGDKWVGENHLGKILMKIREELL